jgi:hypothetical protein
MSNRRVKIAAGAVVLLTLAGGVALLAQEMDHGHTMGEHTMLGEMTHDMGDAQGHAVHHEMADDMPFVAGAMGLPTQAGQGAFAAISEIVALLAADSSTDWSRVNIAALRDHLVDMNLLVTETAVTTFAVDDGIVMTLNLSNSLNAAAARMVPAHVPVLRGETGWASEITQSGELLIWTVTSDADAAQIQAFGFFGLMALGDHHRAHHWAMARGGMMH